VPDFANVVHRRSCPTKVIVLLTAYFDETGTHKQARLTGLSGFIAPAQVWSEIEAAWDTRLKSDEPDYRVATYHAVDCFHGTNEFKNLTYWNRTRRELLTADLAEILAAKGISAITSALLQADWDDVYAKLASDAFRARFPSAYHLCFEHCVQQAFSWSERFASGAPVAFVFAEQSEYQGRAQQILNAYQASSQRGSKIASITFSSPRKLIPLQAADLMAYEMTKSVMQPGVEYKHRWAIERLMKGARGLYGGYYDRESLIGLLNRGPSGDI
jgi:hypothetical protein